MSSVPIPDRRASPCDVEIRQRPEPARALAREREADRGVPSSSSATNAISEAMISRDLGELLLLVRRAFVGGRRDLVVELPPEIGDRVEVLRKLRRRTVIRPSSLPRAGTGRTDSGTARSALPWSGPPRSTVNGRQRRTSRPPCARRGRLPATRAAARGGARGTSRPSSGRAPERRERRDHLVVGERRERVEVEIGVRELEDVLGLRASRSRAP